MTPTYPQEFFNLNSLTANWWQLDLFLLGCPCATAKLMESNNEQNFQKQSLIHMFFSQHLVHTFFTTGVCEIYTHTLDEFLKCSGNLFP